MDDKNTYIKHNIKKKDISPIKFITCQNKIEKLDNLWKNIWNKSDINISKQYHNDNNLKCGNLLLKFWNNEFRDIYENIFTNF